MAWFARVFTNTFCCLGIVKLKLSDLKFICFSSPFLTSEYLFKNYLSQFLLLKWFALKRDKEYSANWHRKIDVMPICKWLALLFPLDNGFCKPKYVVFYQYVSLSNWIYKAVVLWNCFNALQILDLFFV